MQRQIGAVYMKQLGLIGIKRAKAFLPMGFPFQRENPRIIGLLQ
jgi:hypothetical protein